jgi:two-component system, OmpR family, sensor histidine kinase KdpD
VTPAVPAPIRQPSMTAVRWETLARHALRLLVSFTSVAFVTFVGYKVVPVNATTVGFAYLLLVLLIASTWGFLEAALSSVLATLVFNFFFFPPVGTFTIADSHNWVALFSFLATSLIASRLSDRAKQRALEAIERRKDVERLYTFSRAILLIDGSSSFPKQLLAKVVEVFELKAAALYDCRTGEFHRTGTSDLEGVDQQLRFSAVQGRSFSDAQGHRTVTALRLGTQPLAGLALYGALMPDSVLQGVANLVAIGLERARAQDLAQQIEAARQSEQLRTTLIDAMAHEFKTPLTLIKAATTALLAGPEEAAVSRKEQLTIADEEADHLWKLIDNAVEMARLDTTQIDVYPEISNVTEVIRDVVDSMHSEIDDRPVTVLSENLPAVVAFDRRLVKLAIKQLLDNALKYSSVEKPVVVRAYGADDRLTIEITDCGHGIPDEEQTRIFERFYRSPAIKEQIPGSGLGLSIAHRIVQAHGGDLTVTSRPGETTFRMILPAMKQEMRV